LDYQCCDCRWRRGKGFAHGDGGLDLAVFEESNPSDDQSDAQEHY
jgi:hypothetical protein